MDKVIISSLTAEDFERLSYMASYLLQLNFVKNILLLFSLHVLSIKIIMFLLMIAF